MVAALVGVQLAFASWSIVGKVTLGAVDPGALLTVRLGAAAALFAALAARARRPLLPPPGARREMLVLALSGIVLNQLLFLLGLRLTTAINATVLVASVPIVTLVYAVASGREQSRPRLWLGLAVALAGTLAITRPERVSLGDRHLLGNALVLANCVFYSVYLVRGRDAIVRHGVERVVAWVFLLGAAIVLPLGLPAVVAHAPGFSARTWLTLGYIVLVPTVFAYGVNAWALGRAPSSLVAAFVYLQPVAAVALALTVGGPLARWLAVPAPHEALTLRTVLGGVGVVLGVALSRGGSMGRGGGRGTEGGG